MSLVLIGYLDPRLLKEVGDLGKSDLSLLTLPTLHRTRIEADEGSVSPWDSALYVYERGLFLNPSKLMTRTTRIVIAMLH